MIASRQGDQECCQRDIRQQHMHATMAAPMRGAAAVGVIMRTKVRRARIVNKAVRIVDGPRDYRGPIPAENAKSTSPTRSRHWSFESSRPMCVFTVPSAM